MTAKLRLSAEDRAWIEARLRHRLSDALVQMARELGMNPRKLSKLDNHRQQPWKAPLPEFIASLYFRRFGRTRPLDARSVEERARHAQEKKAASKRRRAQRKAEAARGAPLAHAEEQPSLSGVPLDHTTEVSGGVTPEQAPAADPSLRGER